MAGQTPMKNEDQHYLSWGKYKGRQKEGMSFDQ